MIAHLIHTLQSLKIGLKVVDGSLKINAPKGTLTPEIIDQIKVHKSELVALLSSSESIPKAAKKDTYNLTSSQQRLWALSQFESGNTAYNIFNAFEFKGAIDVDALSLAYTRVIGRHESLRTVFKEDTDGVLGQFIIPEDRYPSALRYTDMSTSDATFSEAYIEDFKEHVFDLQAGPLFIGELVKMSDNRHILMFNMHHIIGDGWSMEVLNKEFMTIYNGLSLGQEVKLPELPIQYKDYSEWQHTEARQDKLEKSKAFWLDTFSGELPVLELPSNKARPKIKTYNGSGLDYSFSKEFTSKLNTYTQENGVTLFMTLMAGVNGLLSRYTNTRDIILGTPVAGRAHSDLESQIGLYLNTLAIRTKFEETSTFEELLAIEKETLLNAYSHQEYPFDSLIEVLEIKRDLSRSALFDALVVFQNQRELLASSELQVAGVDITSYEGTKKSFSKFDLSFAFLEVEDQLLLHIEYNTDIYELDFIERLSVHFENFLAKAIQNPQQRIALISFITSSEESQLLNDFNRTTVDLPTTTIVDVFVKQVIKTPEAIAIVYKDKKLTYKELDERSNELAHYLLSNYELGVEDLVGVKLDRNEWLPITVLAILKTGCAYVPIDLNYPEQRITYIEEDSGCEIIVDKEFLTVFEGTASISKELPKVSYTSDNLAYVIYTSGSTGKPKGVMIAHKSLLNLCFWHIETYGLDTSSRGSLYAGIGFDASVWEIYPYLVSGGTLYPISDSEVRYDVQLLTKFLQDNKITHAYLPTKICEELAAQKIALDTVKILTGGEALKLPNEAQGLQIYNNYGPTENTVVTTSFDLKNRVSDMIPIGTPIFNTQLYILSKDVCLQPIGVVGEICIAGVGLSRGYLNQPELTAEKFVKNRFRESGNLYKTGDLGKWLPNGDIEFVGRIDNQIKIRGYRVELGEIENVLIELKSIEQAVVVDCDIENDKVLVAYYVCNEEIDKKSLRIALEAELPEYMIPSYYIEVANIALTANGKVDKALLPQIAEEDLIRNEYVAPVTEIEKQLVTIWEDVLGMNHIGITDNFFELGGHSLKVTLIVNKIKKELGLELSVKDVFLHPTISEIIRCTKESTHVAIPKAEDQNNYVVTSSQRRIWALSQFKAGSVAYNIPVVFHLEGSVNHHLFTEAFRYLMMRHESLRTYFKNDDQGEVRQYILPIEEVQATITVHDLTQEMNKDERASSIINDSYSHCFDLTKAPLITSSLIKLEEKRHLLLLNMHHIISDGWSMEVISREFMIIYDALLKNEDVVLPKLTIQYKDYSEWLHSEQKQSSLSTSKKYWEDTFQGDLPIIELSREKVRPQIKTYHGDHVRHTFSKKISKAITSFSEKNGVSEFMVLMTAVNGIISRYTNTSDIIVGTPIAGRKHQDLENQVGLFLNTLAIRTSFDKHISFESLVAIQKATLLDVYEHQEYPFDNLIDALNIPRDTSRSALFDIMVVYQNQQDILGEQTVAVEGLEINRYKKDSRKVSQFDISFVFSKHDEAFLLQLEYNIDIYELHFIEKLCAHLENFLEQGISNPKIDIQEIHYLTVAEETQLLIDFNKTHTDHPKTTLVDLFIAQTKKTPENIAMVVGSKSFTYRELDEMSNQLANFLLDRYDIASESLIGVKLDRDEWLLISLLAVLKTGSAYVPLDKNYPEERIKYIENDSQCKVTIDSELISSFIKEKDTTSEQLSISLQPENLAYVIYTSGSTGKPKGVMITHANASEMLQWSIKEFKDTDFEIAYAVTSHCFDLSVYEFFYPLSIGKKIRLLDNGLSISDYIANDHKILLNTVPSVVQTLLDRNVSFNQVIGMNLAGEAFPVKLANYFQNHEIKIRNLYGPSEDTTYSSCQIVTGAYDASVPIGKPITNTQFYILSDAMTIQPVGVVGEICISGKGLSKGYLNQPALTNDSFVSHPFMKGERLYKTGDLGRWLSDGTIIYAGRKDSQVKIRGHRIELGEIEHALQGEEGIEQAVVLVKKEDDNQVLVAYIVGSDIDRSTIRMSLGNRLPEYMVPTYFVTLDSLPLTPNGKIDKKSLPEVKEKDLIRNEYVAPVTEIEKQLVAIWEDVLGMSRVGITDNFFELGGHSLKATKLLSIVYQTFNTKVDIEKIFANPTVKFLAIEIENSMWLREIQTTSTVKRIVI